MGSQGPPKKVARKKNTPVGGGTAGEWMCVCVLYVLVSVSNVCLLLGEIWVCMHMR